MSDQGQSLKNYLCEAVLPLMEHGPDTPPMPEEGHRGHRNFLSTRPESYRRLEGFHRFNEGILDDMAMSCMLLYCLRFVIPTLLSGIDKHISDETIDEDPVNRVSGTSLSVEANGLFGVTNKQMRLPYDIRG